MTPDQINYDVNIRYVTLASDKLTRKRFCDRIALYLIGIEFKTHGQDDGGWGVVEAYVHRRRDGSISYQCGLTSETVTDVIWAGGDDQSDRQKARCDYIEETVKAAARLAWEMHCATEGTACES